MQHGQKQKHKIRSVEPFRDHIESIEASRLNDGQNQSDNMQSTWTEPFVPSVETATRMNNCISYGLEDIIPKDAHSGEYEKKKHLAACTASSKLIRCHRLSKVWNFLVGPVSFACLSTQRHSCAEVVVESESPDATRLEHTSKSPTKNQRRSFGISNFTRATSPPANTRPDQHTNHSFPVGLRRHPVKRGTSGAVSRSLSSGHDGCRAVRAHFSCGRTCRSSRWSDTIRIQIQLNTCISARTSHDDAT